MKQKKEVPGRKRIDGKSIAPSSIRPFHLHDETVQFLLQLLRLYIPRADSSTTPPIPGPSAGSRVYNEKPTYIGDNTFVTQSKFMDGSLIVYVNQLRIPVEDVMTDGFNKRFKLSNVYPADELYVVVDYTPMLE